MGKPRNKNKNSKVKVVRKKDKEAIKQKKIERQEEKEAEAAALPPGMVLDSEYRSATGVLTSQPLAKDVKIGSFTLIAHSKQLIHDTDLEFTIGRRYGLLGANGCGKSTFLRCLANREVPIPQHIDIFLLETEAPPEPVSAIDAVVKYAEAKMKYLEDEAERLIVEEGPESEAVMECYERLEDMDPSTFRKRAGELLHGLGFGQEMLSKHTKDMSGGWRMRVSLAQALFAKPKLLLLDEPTAHLDLGSVVWLERYLSTYPYCLLVVSHSHDFLNGVCTNILEITKDQKLAVYGGNYDAYVKTKKENAVNQLKRYKKEQEDIKSIKQFIASAGTYANLVRQAKSKQKILDAMYARGLTKKPEPDQQFNFRFPEVDMMPPPMLQIEDLSFSYSGKEEDFLYTDLNLAVPPDARIVIVGDNGTGKSTLIKLMVGELQPVKGQIRRHLDLKFARYHQHSAELLPDEKSPVDFLKEEYADRKLDTDEWRRHLGRFGITGNTQTSKMGTMSDGLKNRMVFCLMALENPNCLMLDEPTNHLDATTIDALANAINAYKGAVITVSHDFSLVNQIAKELWVVEDKTIKRWPGDVRSYKQYLVEQMDKNTYVHKE